MPSNDDEIAALLRAATSEGDTTELNDAERFIVACGIKAGDYKCPAIHIWYKYVEWAEKPISREKFFQQFRKIFPRSRNTMHKFYRLDPSSFDTSEEHKFLVNKKLREIRLKRKEEWKRRSLREAKPSTQD